MSIVEAGKTENLRWSFLADRTGARSYWHDNVVSLSVGLSVYL